MAIKGLTDQDTPRMPSVGTIRKGAKKEEGARQPGADLSWFRLDTKDKGVQELWDVLYPEEPREIKIFLPHNDIEDNFSAWMEHWVAGGLVHRCDGEKVVVQRGKNGDYETWAEGEGPDCPGGCAIAGRLAVMIPEMRRMATLTVVTSSKHDILNLSANLLRYYEMRQNLQGIPFILRRVERAISTPSGKKGARARRKKWLLQLEPAPTWVSAQLSYLESIALPRIQLPAIAAPKARIEADPTWRKWDLEVMAANGEDAPEPVIDAEPVLAEPPQRVVHIEPIGPVAVETPPSPTYDRAAFLLRADLAAKTEMFQRGYAGGIDDGRATDLATSAQAGLVASLFTEAFAPDENATKEYHSALKFLFRVDSAKGLTFCQARAALAWLTGKKDPETGEYPLNDGVAATARLCLREAMLAAGQIEMVGLGEEE